MSIAENPIEIWLVLDKDQDLLRVTAKSQKLPVPELRSPKKLAMVA